MTATRRLSLPYLSPSQSQKHVTVNESLRLLDAIVQLSVISATTTAEPGAPSDGDCYILPAGKTGAAWGAMTDGAVACYVDGAWMQLTPRAGWLAHVADAKQHLVWNGASWGGLQGAFLDKALAADTCLVTFRTGGSARSRIGLIGADDLRLDVSADGAAWTNALFVKNAGGHVGVGTANPADRLHVNGGNVRTGNVNASSPRFIAEASDIAGQAYFGWDNGAIAQMGTASAHALRVMIANNERARFYTDGGVTIGAPAGGSKGAGTLNAAGVYDDNVLLSCYVFDQALDGAIDFAKWDAKAPAAEGRLHRPMRRFAARIGGAHDPLTLDGYASCWKEKRHLSSMPDEAIFDPASGLAVGDWVQRLIETVEIQAVLIETLNQRLKAVETTQRARP